MEKVSIYFSSIFSGAKIAVAEIEKNPDSAKILALRGLLISCLVAAAITTTLTSYDNLKDNEYKLFKSQFRTTAQNSLSGVVDSFDRMNMGIQGIASTYSHNFPDQETWPHSAWTGFIPTIKHIGRVSAVETVMVLPIVQADQVDQYQEYITSYYNSTDSYVNIKDTMIPVFPPGTIWRANRTTLIPSLFADRYGNSTVSKHQILTPIMQYSIQYKAQWTGYNMHADSLYTSSIDALIDCVQNNTDEISSVSCGVLMPAVRFPYVSNFHSDINIEDVVAGFLQPIFPSNNQSVLVGMVAGSIGWKHLLTRTFPESINGLYCVISTDIGAFTFYIKQGKACFLGLGDLHDTKFTKFGQSSPVLNPKVRVARSSTYMLTVYPSSDFLEDYTSNLPVTGALVLLVIFLFCSALFATYDVLMQRKFGRNQAVLDTKRRFVRFISHEIRTPLNIIALGMKLLDVEMDKVSTNMRKKNSNEMQVIMNQSLRSWKHLAKEIVESSESAVEVLNDLLNYDKIEVGALKLEFSHFSICEVVTRTVSMLQVQAQLKDINIQLFYPPCRGSRDEAVHEDLLLDDCMVVGDVVRIGQVLRNLISNALKFTPSAGAVTVTVTTSPTCLSLPEKVRVSSPLFQTMAQAGTVQVAVKDSGAGLSPHQLEQICAEGVQFNANELQAGQGSGLGLFISKGIVEQHGGELTVTSEGLGKGVTFTIALSIFKTDFKMKSVRNSSQSVGSRLQHSNAKQILVVPTMKASMTSTTDDVLPLVPSAHNDATTSLVTSSVTGECDDTTFRLLVVDDSPFNRKMLIRLLSSKEHKCEQAEDGQVALRKYEEMLARGEPPDAILMDFEMPVMNGPAATARLREMGCRCLIVGVTGNVLPADVAYFKEHGADAVLPKPLILEDFELILAQSLCARTFSNYVPDHIDQQGEETCIAASGVRKNSEVEGNVEDQNPSLRFSVKGQP